jgi:hypothetical protein
MKRISRRIVIDASIARAAGTTKDRVSSACRAFLKALYTICHRAVICPELKKEWNKHQSLFFKRWRSSMVARKKLIDGTCVAVPALEAAIAAGSFGSRQEFEVRKDQHLITLALGADSIVVSGDDTAHAYWRRLTKQCANVGQIVWVNPVHDATQAVDWLQRGAPAEKHRQLGT